MDVWLRGCSAVRQVQVYTRGSNEKTNESSVIESKNQITVFANNGY